jgi:flagellar biosynthesis/type III secretory pathway chaperone
MISASLDMLQESLVKKLDILEKLEEENEIQKEILSSPDVDREADFDSVVDRKAGLIDQLELLDDGFQTLFDKVKAEVNENKELYKDKIKVMQDLIQQITAKSASIEASERRNKRLAEKYFSTLRQSLNTSRQTSAAAFNYYRTMNNFRDIPPQFLDNKN